MDSPNPNDLLAGSLLASLAELGLSHVVVTPGSRNTPAVVPAVRNTDLIVTGMLDERAGAFFALGAARATGLPTAIIVTSGTAVGALLPAVLEANHDRVPLLVITADRPAELRGFGAPQTADQPGIFGANVRWSHDASPEAGSAAGYASALAMRTWSSLMGVPPGPVHLNLAFRKPLTPSADAELSPSLHWIGGDLVPDRDAIDRASQMLSNRRGLIVAGPLPSPADGAAVARLGSELGIPVLADVLSNARWGDHDRGAVISSGGHIAAAEAITGSLEPEVVIRFGATPTSGAIRTWMQERRDLPQILIGPAGWGDDTRTATIGIGSNPQPAATALGQAATPGDGAFLGAWRQAETAALGVIDGLLGPVSEPMIARTLSRAVGPGGQIYAASSMPIRDLDLFGEPSSKALRVMANRGLNGIDGFLASAAGAAKAADRPSYALAGDLSFLYDSPTLATISRDRIPLTIVVVNNDGGGIFRFLPERDLPEFDRYIAAPHAIDLGAVANAFGVKHQLLDSIETLTELLGTPREPLVLELKTDAVANVRLHDEITSAVAAALA